MRVLITILLLVVSGCASKIAAPAIGRYPIKECTNIYVSDQRPYVLAKSKPPTFIGSGLDTAGHSADFYTWSNMPVANELAKSLRGALEGQEVEIIEQDDLVLGVPNKCRQLVLKITDWKVTAGGDATFFAAADLELYATNGSKLASSRLRTKLGLLTSSINPQAAAEQHYLIESEIAINTLLEHDAMLKAL